MEDKAHAGATPTPQYFVTLPSTTPTFPITAELGEDEAALRRALGPFVPDAFDAELRREERGGEVHITVFLRAGRKGCHEDCPHPAQHTEAPTAQASGRVSKSKMVFISTNAH